MKKQNKIVKDVSSKLIRKRYSQKNRLDFQTHSPEEYASHARMELGKLYLQKQPSRRVLRKKFPENMQQIYRRTTMTKCDFNKLTLQFY